MKFILLDRNEKWIRNLEDITTAIHTEEINGEDILEFTTVDYKDIQKKYRVLYKTKYGYWKEFIVEEIEETHDIEGLGKRIFCESSFYETFGDYIEDELIENSMASMALERALSSSRWQVGTVDDLGHASVDLYNVSVKEGVQKITQAWKGELRTRITVSGNKVSGRYVDLLERIGEDNGVRFTYGKNVEHIRKIIHRDEVVTALYGYGKGLYISDDYTVRLNFADINNGKAYLENNEAKEIWGRLNSDGTRSHIFGKVIFDGAEWPEEVMELTQEKLEELSQPNVTYEVGVMDVGNCDLGDYIIVTDKEFDPPLRLKARVARIERDLLEENNNQFTVGNIISNIADEWNRQQEYIDNFRDRSDVWDRSKIIDEDGSINAQFLNNLVDEMNKQMNSRGGYVYLSEDGDGIITYDTPDSETATMAIQILGGSFRIANSKLSNGEWNWRTFGDGRGFVADEIITGILQGGKVKFDLTNGTLLIGNSIDDYSLYFDGNKLHIKLGDGKTIEEEINDKIEDAIRDIDFEGDIHIGTEPPEDPQEGSLWLDISSITPAFKIYQEDQWVDITADVDLDDVYNAIGDLDKRVTNTELKITDEAIVSTVRESQYYIDDLTGKVGVSEIISRINQTAEAITIDANKINLNGVVTIDAFSPSLKSDFNSKVTSSEVTTITNNTIQTTNVLASNLRVRSANISGTLTANQIDVTGITRIYDSTNPLQYIEMFNNTFRMRNRYYNSEIIDFGIQYVPDSSQITIGTLNNPPREFFNGIYMKDKVWFNDLELIYGGFAYFEGEAVFNRNAYFNGSIMSDINFGGSGSKRIYYGNHLSVVSPSGITISAPTVDINSTVNLPNASNVYIGNTRINNMFAAISHNHSASNINSGTISYLRLPRGTTSTTVAIGNHNHNSDYIQIRSSSVASQGSIQIWTSGIEVYNASGKKLGTLRYV